jgi:hypothetical protein
MGKSFDKSRMNVTAQVARKISLFRLLKTAELCDKGEHEIIA